MKIQQVDDRGLIKEATELTSGMNAFQLESLEAQIRDTLDTFLTEDLSIQDFYEVLQNGTAIDLMKFLTNRSDVCQALLDITNEVHEVTEEDE